MFSHDIGFDANLRLKRRPDNKSGTFLGVLIVAILLFKRYYRDFRCGSYAHGQAYSAEAGVDVESVAGKQEQKQAEATDSITALEYARSMGAGWNLGNQFDAYKDGVASETAQRSPQFRQYG